MIRLGMWSTLLLLGSLHGLAVAALLLAARRNRIANRCLAALLVAVVAMITPYTLGYAGAYDAWPWLTFAPFYWHLAFGPLLYLHVRALGEQALPPRWWLHLLPGALQGAYYVVLFALPLQAKWDWNDHWHEPLAMPLQNIAALASLATYWWLARRRYRRYQRWLEANSARHEDLRLGWVRGFLWAVAVVVVLNAGFQIVDVLISPLDYFDYFPFYLALGLLVYYLGIEGWRHANLPLPPMTDAPPDAPTDLAAPEIGPVVARPVPDRDWRAQGEAWAARVAEAGWWREPDLSLTELARRLGTNTHYLSRALNDGLGTSFSQFVNRLRVEEAKRRLRGDGDILSIALDVGFGSKASFNRVFRAETGTTPSAWRDARRLES